MEEQSDPVKRGRGRPRKNPLPAETPAVAVVAETPKPKKRIAVSRPKSTVSFVLILVLIAALASSAYFYKQYRDTQNKLKNPTAAAQNESAALVAKVGKLIELPTAETPTVATVSDVNKLSGQTFFSSAKNGDKVLIYSQAKKAVLYRPSTNKIINVAPLNVGSGTTQGTTPAQ